MSVYERKETRERGEGEGALRARYFAYALWPSRTMTYPGSIVPHALFDLMKGKGFWAGRSRDGDQPRREISRALVTRR